MSRQRTAILDDSRPAADDDALDSAAATGSRSPRKSRSARKKRALFQRTERALFQRTGVVLPAAGIATLLVVVVVVASYLMAPQGTGASSLFASIDNLDHSGSVTALEQEQQTIIAMDAAASTLTVDAKPAMASPASVLAAESAASSTGGTGQAVGAIQAPAAPADPSGAEAIGKALLPSFGFNQTTQWNCLYNLWMRESGWDVYADNTESGAYGIPQAVPGDKMASVASDWRTDPTTQIKWGLGYIASTYGTPCGAWQNEEATGSY